MLVIFKPWFSFLSYVVSIRLKWSAPHVWSLPFLLKLWSAIGALDYGERASALFAQLLALAELFEGVPAEAFGASKQCYRLSAGSAARRTLGATRSSRLRSHSHPRVLSPLDTAVRSWTGSDLHVPPRRSRSSQKCAVCPDNFFRNVFQLFTNHNSRVEPSKSQTTWWGPILTGLFMAPTEWNLTP